MPSQNGTGARVRALRREKSEPLEEPTNLHDVIHLDGAKVTESCY